MSSRNLHCPAGRTHQAKITDEVSGPDVRVWEIVQNTEDKPVDEIISDLSMFVGRPAVALPAKRTLLSMRSPLRNLQRDVMNLDAEIGDDLIVLQEFIYIYIYLLS